MLAIAFPRSMQDSGPYRQQTGSYKIGVHSIRMALANCWSEY